MSNQWSRWLLTLEQAHACKKNRLHVTMSDRQNMWLLCQEMGLLCLPVIRLQLLKFIAWYSLCLFKVVGRLIKFTQSTLMNSSMAHVNYDVGLKIHKLPQTVLPCIHYLILCWCGALLFTCQMFRKCNVIMWLCRKSFQDVHSLVDCNFDSCFYLYFVVTWA